MTNEIAVHPGGRLLATTTSLGIVLSDLVTGVRLAFLPRGSCRFPRFDADGNLYALSGGVDRWPIKVRDNGYQVGAPERLPTPAGIGGFDVSAVGNVAASTFNGAVFVDRQTGKRTSLQPQTGVRLVAISPDSTLVASFGFGTGNEGFRVWEAKTGKLIHVHRTGVNGYGRFTPDRKHVVSFGQDENELLLWSMPDCKIVRKLGSLGNFAISSDSRYIAVAEWNGKARLTRIADGALIARFDAPREEYLAAIAFSPDGRFLVGTTIERNKHHVWDLWKLRRRLAVMKLDWESEPALAPPAVTEPIVVEIVPAVKSKP